MVENRLSLTKHITTVVFRTVAGKGDDVVCLREISVQSQSE